jgi:parallel beta-helix repeat protein
VFNGDLYTAGSILESAIIEGVAEHINGAVRVESSSPFIQLSEIRDNLTAGISAVNAAGLRIIDNRIHNNQISSSWGGGVAVRNSSGIRVIRNQINDNTALTGGGVVIDDCDNALITDNTFQRNVGRDRGAGFAGLNSSGISFLRNVLDENANTSEYPDRLVGAADFDASSNVLLQGNTVEGTNSVAAMVFEDIIGLTMQGDHIVNNTGHGLYFNRGVTNAVVSASNSDPTIIAGNGGYEIYNNQLFELSTNPLAKGNVDARNVWWKTSDISAVQADVFDFSDNSFKGIIFLDPIKNLADFDGDSDVDGDDLNHPTLGWAARFGTDLDGADFLRWQRDLGFGVPSASPLAAVPEPRCTSLLFVAGIWIFSRVTTVARRRRFADAIDAKPAHSGRNRSG